MENESKVTSDKPLNESGAEQDDSATLEKEFDARLAEMDAADEAKRKDDRFKMWCTVIGCLLFAPIAIVVIVMFISFLLPLLPVLILAGLGWVGLKLISATDGEQK